MRPKVFASSRRRFSTGWEVSDRSTTIFVGRKIRQFFFLIWIFSVDFELKFIAAVLACEYVDMKYVYVYGELDEVSYSSKRWHSPRNTMVIEIPGKLLSMARINYRFDGATKRNLHCLFWALVENSADERCCRISDDRTADYFGNTRVPVSPNPAASNCRHRSSCVRFGRFPNNLKLINGTGDVSRTIHSFEDRRVVDGGFLI